MKMSLKSLAYRLGALLHPYGSNSTVIDGIAIVLLVSVLCTIPTLAQESVELAIGNPNAVIDLRTESGIKLVGGSWRYQPARVVERQFASPGPEGSDSLDLYPTGPLVSTFDIEPKAGSAEFDDSRWSTIAPGNLEMRLGNGLLSFVWYRMNVTLPDRIGSFDPTGSTVVFEIVVDDYAEIWVNGKLNRTFGQSGGTTIKGFNARNRVTLTENAKPGERFQIAVLGINGPIADIPKNYIWVRSATLDFYHQRPSLPGWTNVGKVVRINAGLDQIIDPDASIDRVATGFQFTEGPSWHRDGYLLFSDPNANVIYSLHPNGNVAVYRTKSGYAGIDIGAYRQPGSNGLAFDAQGRLIVCEHGNRRVVRHEPKGPVTVLADRYRGQRLNSPNDVIVRSDGVVYFTDPPYGLPGLFDDPKKELPHQGVYAVVNGVVRLVASDLGGPNGLAFSPDEKMLYVSNWDTRDIHRTKVIWRYDVLEDGSLRNGREFFNMNLTDDDEALDGLKVDRSGNIFASGPGGIWILSPSGQYLGKIVCPERPSNMAFGGPDGKTLYMTAHRSVYRVRVNISGIRP